MASLQHPNIIKLRGISHGGAMGFADGPGGYFLIIDRLFETLDQRIRKWRHTGSKMQKSLSRMKSMKSVKSLKRSGSMLGSTDTETRLLDERLTIGEYNSASLSLYNVWRDTNFASLLPLLITGLQIAAGMSYLHNHSVIFRDLKPQNIGFDVRGDVKIFDFGLSRIMPENGDPYRDKFNMSGAGSPRYMAPECLDVADYNLKADVYTFSVVLWEVLSAQTPFVHVRSRDELVRHVVDEGGRPRIDPTWPVPIQGMLECGFDPDMGRRPVSEMIRYLWEEVCIVKETFSSHTIVHLFRK